MSKFSEALRETVPQPCFGRPFVCDGNPENCSVVVIGENPATKLAVDWWSYWDDSTGFQFTKWNEMYQGLRTKDGKSAVSNTRRRLDRLRQHGIKCLETNVFLNERLSGPGRGTPNADLLELAINTLTDIRFIIAHGRMAEAYISPRVLPSCIRKVFRTKHFRNESYATIDRIASEILA